MTERVARALCAEDPDETDARIGDDGRHYPDGEPHWKAWTSDARAAIEAMREPTPRMAVAGGYSIACQFTDPLDVFNQKEADVLDFDLKEKDEGAHKMLAPYAAECWTAMINEILTPGEEYYLSEADDAALGTEEKGDVA